MLKGSANLMYIESDDSDSSGPDKLANAQKPSEVRKGNSHKLDGGIIRRSLFSNPELEEGGFIIQDYRPKDIKSKKNIKYIGTIEHKKLTEPSKKKVITEENEEDFQCISLSTIERKKVEDDEQESSHQTEKQLLRLTAPARRNILEVDIDDDSESESQGRSQSEDKSEGESKSEQIEVRVQSDSEEQTGRSAQQEKDEKIEVQTKNNMEKMEVRQIQSSDIQAIPVSAQTASENLNNIEELQKRYFSHKKIETNEILKTLIQRLDSGVNYFLPQLDCNFMDDFAHIISAKKQIGTNFQYVISSQRNDITDSPAKSLGKVVANFSNTVFNTFEYRGENSEMVLACTCRFIDEPDCKTVSPKCYQLYLLKEGVKYWELEGVSKDKKEVRDLIQLLPMNGDKIKYFRNKKPQFLEQAKSFILNFNGRITKGSIKNFIVEDSETGKEVLMFGKGNGDFFNAYISYPLSPFMAMAWIIPYFSSRIISK